MFVEWGHCYSFWTGIYPYNYQYGVYTWYTHTYIYITLKVGNDEPIEVAKPRVENIGYNLYK